jgi:DNA-binding transcriptional LysR family regulator
MELDHVEAFLAVARHGGFTRAAAVLHLSQPAISRRLHLLERELGAPLFERVGQRTRLTEAGRVFERHAEAMLAAVRDGRDAVAALAGGERGEIALAIVGTLASTPLAQRLRRFADRHVGVTVHVRTALSVEVSSLVRRGEADLGLRYEIDRDPALVARVVGEEALVPICAPAHSLARRRSLDAAALAGERWLTFPPRPGATREAYAAAFARGLAAAGLDGAELVPVDSLTAQKRMVEAGFGLGLLPRSAVEEELRAGTLVVLRAPGVRSRIPIVLVHRRGAFQSGAVRALASILGERPPKRREGSAGQEDS